MRSAEHYQAHLSSIKGALTAPMLAAPGKKFFTGELAALAGVTINNASSALNSAHNNPARCARVNREQVPCNGMKLFRYWIGEAAIDDRTRVIAWLKKHKRSANISKIAEALKMEFYEASGLLDEMHRRQDVVRCYLPLGGMDCYEYRLMGVA